MASGVQPEVMGMLALGIALAVVIFDAHDFINRSRARRT